MPENIKVFNVNGDPAARKQISDLFSLVSDITIIGEAESLDKGIQMIKELKPDVTIVGEFVRGSDGFQFCEALMEQLPYQPVILATYSAGEAILRKALRSGVKEVVESPWDEMTLSGAVYRMYDLRRKHQSTLNKSQERSKEIPKEKTAQIISVFSTKGGVGKTTIASNLAVTLGQRNKKVALLDLDVFSGDIALAMDIPPGRNISDLIIDIGRLDLDLLESYMYKHSTGVMVLPAPMQPEYSDFISADHIKKILGILLKDYDYIVVDCASYMHDPVLVALDASDLILLVTTMDLFAIKNLKSCINALEGLNYSKRRFRIIVNRVFKDSGINIKDITTTLGLPASAVLPQEEQIIVSSINQGIPAVLSFKKSRFSREIYDFAKGIMKDSSGA